MPTEPKSRFHPISLDALENHLPEFYAQLHHRLRRGMEEYGDTSFLRPCEELIDELSQEALDLSGWSFILWCRLRKLRDALREGHLDGHGAFNGSDDAA